MSDKTILITGGTRGIGKAIALSQAAKGTTLLLNYLRDDASAQKVKSAAEKKGAKVTLIPANVGDPEGVASLFGAVKKEVSHLNALVHSAALGVFKPVHQLRVKD